MFRATLVVESLVAKLRGSTTGPRGPFSSQVSVVLLVSESKYSSFDCASVKV